MPEQVDRTEKEIEIDVHGAIASEIATAVAEMWADNDSHLIQSVTGDIERMRAEHEVLTPPEILEVATEAVEEHGHPEVPDDPDAFGVLSIDVSMDHQSTLTVAIEEVIE